MADYLEVDRPVSSERWMPAWATWSSTSWCRRHEQAAAGLQLVREQGSGRCGFIVTAGPGEAGEPAPGAPGQGLVPLSAAVAIAGPYAGAIRAAIGEGWIAETFEQAAAAARLTRAPVATLSGEVFHGPHVIVGGDRSESRGILATKGEIKELRERLGAERDSLSRLAEETAAFETTIAQATSAIDALSAEQHRQEKAILGFELQVGRATDEEVRLTRKRELVLLDRRRAEEERDGLDARQAEAQASVARIEDEQRLADERLAVAQRRLFEARETTDELGRRAAEARAAHAALVERASALALEVGRLEEANRDLESRNRIVGP